MNKCYSVNSLFLSWKKGFWRHLDPYKITRIRMLNKAQSEDDITFGQNVKCHSSLQGCTNFLNFIKSVGEALSSSLKYWGCWYEYQVWERDGYFGDWINIFKKNGDGEEYQDVWNFIRLCLFQGCKKFPTIWFSSPPPIFKFWIFFPKISVPFPSSPLDNLPYSLKIVEQMILIPFFPRDILLKSP